MNLRASGLTASKPVFDRFRDGMLKANHLVAGPDADLAAQVRAAQAIAMLSDPVVLFADAPVASCEPRSSTASTGPRASARRRQSHVPAAAGRP